MISLPLSSGRSSPAIEKDFKCREQRAFLLGHSPDHTGGCSVGAGLTRGRKRRRATGSWEGARRPSSDGGSHLRRQSTRVRVLPWSSLHVIQVCILYSRLPVWDPPSTPPPFLSPLGWSDVFCAHAFVECQVCVHKCRLRAGAFLGVPSAFFLWGTL